MNSNHTQLIRQAQAVLDDNWMGTFTRPAPRLYPHQWSWDSAFIAIARAHYDQVRADQELRSLFRGQWDNGLLPRIIFNSEYTVGHTAVTIAAMVVSGICALLIGFLFGGNPVLIVLISLLWGFFVIADSAQFSAAISELCRAEFTGTALTLQTSLGFLLTLITIRLIPTLENLLGRRWAFSFLTIGPTIGVWAMYTLRKLPEAKRLAGGKR